MKKILLAAGSLLFVILLLEIGLRIAVGRVFPPRFFEPHPDFGHFHRPNVEGWQRTGEYESYVAINAKGLRDRDFPYEKPEGTYRILVLGDSFTEGLQVDIEKTFPKQLETLLNEQAASPVEVINAGVSRYGTDRALLFLEEEGLKYHPDLIIYALYPNDITDNVESGLFRIENGRLVQHSVEISTWEQVRGFLYDTSYLYRIGLATYLILRQQNDPTLIETEWGLVLPIYRADLQPREIRAWELSAALLNRLAENPNVMVVYLPEIFQTENDLWAKVENSEETLVRDAPNMKLAEIMPANLTFIDLSPEFREVGQDTSLYYVSDGHFNAAGHALTARLLAPVILAKMGQ